MARVAPAIVEAIVADRGPAAVLERLSDAAVCSDGTASVLNLVAAESAAARRAITGACNLEPAALRPELARLLTLELPARHWVDVRRDVARGNLHRVLLTTYERAPADFEAVLFTPGVGPAALRAQTGALRGRERQGNGPARSTGT